MKNKEVKEKKKWIIAIIILLLVIICVLLFFVFGIGKKYTATFDTDGGSEIDKIIIEKDKTILLPVDPTK